MTDGVVPLLVSAGEASADRLAALTLRALPSVGLHAYCFGLGAVACHLAGMRPVEPSAQAPIIGLMGVTPVLRRAYHLARAFRALLQAARRLRPRAALLVGCSEFNTHLGRRLRRIGIPVLWCAAPQVWASRASRLSRLHDAVDTIAVILPFEQPLWASAGYDAYYVGHPAEELTRAALSNATADASIRSSARPRRLVLLPGSRDHEVRTMLTTLITAATRWRTLQQTQHNETWAVRAVLSQALAPGTQSWTRDHLRAANIETITADSVLGAPRWLLDSDLSLCVSGTASLEACLAGAFPIIAYRTDPITAAVAKHVVTTPLLGLPNILLDRQAFPELVQRQLTPTNLVRALASLHTPQARRAASQAQTSLRNLLHVNDDQSYGKRTARLLQRLLHARNARTPGAPPAPSSCNHSRDSLCHGAAVSTSLSDA